MNVELFLKIYAVYLSLLASVWIFNPKAGLEEDSGPHSTFVARLLGVNGIMIGFMAWVVSSQPQPLVRDFLWVGLVVNVAPLLLIGANIVQGTFRRKQFAGIITHMLPLVGFVYFLVALG